MPKQPKEVGGLDFWKVPVTIKVIGQLHATSPQNPEDIAYMLERQPSEAVLAAREAVGKPTIPIEELAEQVMEEVRATEKVPSKAVFRRDKNGVIFIHENWIIGHLKDAGDSISRAIGFWGLEKFIKTTVSVVPPRIYIQGEVKESEVGVETWPTHFDVYRMGRLSSFRVAEYVENPEMQFNLYLVADPRWTKRLLYNLFGKGSIQGFGGGRGRRLAKYTFRLGEWERVPGEQVWGLLERQNEEG